MLNRGRGSTSFIRTTRVAALAFAALAAALLGSPANAVVVRAHRHTFGVTPTHSARGRTFARTHTAARSPRGFDEGPQGGTPLLDKEKGPVMHSSETHVIYWDPSKEFTETTKGIVNKFFADVAHDSGQATNVFGIIGQFTDGGGNAAYKSKFAGAVNDTDSYPSNGCAAPAFEADPGPPYTHCLIDEQLRTELTNFIGAKSLPRGPTQFYALLLPHKVVTCIDAEFEECSSDVFCAYHSSIEPGSVNEILYADIPFSLLDEAKSFGEAFPIDVKGCQDDGHPENIEQPNPDSGVKGENSATRFADVAVKYISHEFAETQTDPLGNAWLDKNGLEIGDKCNGVSPDEAKDGIGYDKNSFLPVLGGKAEEDNLFNQAINSDHFYIQSEWDNVAKACRMTPLEVSGTSFTSSPASAVEGSPVEFKGAASDPYGHPEFQWKFGDGSEGTGATVTHSYALEGTYAVTMTVKDALTGSTTTPTKHSLSVDELPLAAFTVEPLTIIAKTKAKFDGKESEDPDEPAGKIEKYRWNFGDETEAEGEKVEHEYTTPGEYLVTLTIEDSSKLTAEESEFITVIDRPAVVTGAASAVGQTGATLNASVNPNGSFVKECALEYGKTAAYEHVAPCSPSPGQEFEPVAVSATIAGLEPETEYHYRVVARNEVPEQSKGLDKTFTTLKKLSPAITGEAAGPVTQTGATLNGLVNPNGAEVTACKFEYGTTAGFYEASVPCTALPVGAGTSPVAATASISGLSPNTTYHFRLVAASNGGEGAGTDTTFTTAALPPPPPKEEGAKIAPPPPPDSSFTAGASVNHKTGAITFTTTVKNPGTFSALATFANGGFGVFAAKAAKCKRGYLRLAGKCRRSKVTFAKASISLSGAGAATFTLRPSSSARKALQFALKHRRGLPVTVVLAFQSSRGGTPVTKLMTVVVKLKGK